MIGGAAGGLGRLEVPWFSSFGLVSSSSRFKCISFAIVFCWKWCSYTSTTYKILKMVHLVLHCNHHSRAQDYYPM